MAVAQLQSTDHRLPLYQRLRDVFRSEIARGTWTPDRPVPTEEDLAARFGVAVGTVRKAFEGLVASGDLERRPGRGTFVRRAEFRNALARFFRVTDTAGHPLQPSARILDRRDAAADGPIAERLGVPVRTRTLKLFRLRLVDGGPILAEEIALPYARFAALAALPTDEFGDLLYPLYERVCGHVIARAREQITFGAAPAHVAAALQIAPGSPVAIIERVACGYDGKPLEYRRSYGPAERFSYAIDIR